MAYVGPYDYKSPSALVSGIKTLLQEMDKKKVVIFSIIVLESFSAWNFKPSTSNLQEKMKLLLQDGKKNILAIIMRLRWNFFFKLFLLSTRFLDF